MTDHEGAGPGVSAATAADLEERAVREARLFEPLRILERALKSRTRYTVQALGDRRGRLVEPPAYEVIDCQSGDTLATVVVAFADDLKERAT